MSSSAIKLLVQTSRPDWNQFLQLLNTAFSIRESRKACFPTRRTNRPPQSPVLTIRKKTGTWNTTDSSDPFRVSVLPSLVCNRKKNGMAWGIVTSLFEGISVLAFQTSFRGETWVVMSQNVGYFHWYVCSEMGTRAPKLSTFFSFFFFGNTTVK